jgi:hypothetical protein
MSESISDSNASATDDQASAPVDVQLAILARMATVNGFWPGTGIDASVAGQIPCK